MKVNLFILLGLICFATLSLAHYSIDTGNGDDDDVNIDLSTDTIDLHLEISSGEKPQSCRPPGWRCIYNSRDCRCCQYANRPYYYCLGGRCRNLPNIDDLTDFPYPSSSYGGDFSGYDASYGQQYTDPIDFDWSQYGFNEDFI